MKFWAGPDVSTSKSIARSATDLFGVRARMSCQSNDGPKPSNIHQLHYLCRLYRIRHLSNLITSMRPIPYISDWLLCLTVWLVVAMLRVYEFHPSTNQLIALVLLTPFVLTIQVLIVRAFRKRSRKVVRRGSSNEKDLLGSVDPENL